MSGWNSMPIGTTRGDAPRDPIHRPAPDASPVEAEFTRRDRSMLETEQRLNRTPGGAAFAQRIRSAGP